MCRSESTTLLVCTAPALSGGDPDIPLDRSINYTIIMDNAPGPSNSGDLRLSLATTNPNISNNALDMTDYTIDSGSPITINVRTTCTSSLISENLIHMMLLWFWVMFRV